VIPTLPLRLRNRLAGTILAALHDRQARRELIALADAGAHDWLKADETRWARPLVARARAASAALADRPPLAHEADLGQALQAAAALFDAGLYFEVHEVLEPHWVAARGETREALQGLIQIAVGYQHRADGNALGAHALLGEGVTRVRGRHLGGMSLDEFAEAVAETIGSTAAGAETPRVVPRFPRASARLTSAAATPPP
jgi:predicted metal-dependent hydrolase